MINFRGWLYFFHWFSSLYFLYFHSSKRWPINFCFRSENNSHSATNTCARRGDENGWRGENRKIEKYQPEKLSSRLNWKAWSGTCSQKVERSIRCWLRMLCWEITEQPRVSVNDPTTDSLSRIIPKKVDSPKFFSPVISRIIFILAFQFSL